MNGSTALVVRRAAPPPEPPLEETRAILATGARRRFGAIPELAIAEHVLAMTDGADFPVRKAALDALARRMSFAVRDGLVVTGRPARGAVHGVYTTARAAAEGEKASRKGRARAVRPWETEIAPPRVAGVFRAIGGSCDCPDFVRSSLGLCKHLLAVLDRIHEEGGGDRLASVARTRSRPATRLAWDPALPLLGPLDRLRGIRLEIGDDGVKALPAALRRAFDGLVLRHAALDDPHTRLELLHRLEAFEASPAARRVVEEEHERAKRGLRCAAHAPAASQHLATLGRKLYPYQRAGVKRLLEQGRLLLADDMGLGKTTQAIAACHALFHSRRVKRGVVIAPASLKPQWLREWEDTTSVPARLVDGTPEERARIYAAHEEGFLILGYEQLLRDIAHVQALAPDLVVVDEAQRIKNYATKSAVYVKALEPEYRLVLTGTPMENRLEELASILDWVDDVALSPKWRLVPWHTFDDGDGARGATGARNLKTLRERVGTATMRRVRKDVLTQLPPRTDTRVPVPMTEQQKARHDELDQPIAALVASARKRPLTQPEFLRLMSFLTTQRIVSNGLAQLRFDETWEACSGRTATPALLEGLFAPKLGVLRALIADLVGEQDRKVVVFSQWRRMLRLAEWAVRDVLAETGRRAAFFTGAESQAKRTKAIADFHDDPRVAVMFLSDAGGVGLNLQRPANACVNLELPWNPAVLEQRIGRIYRLGQKAPIDVYSLVTEQGIESRIAGVVGAKQALFDGVFEATADAVSFDASGSFLSQVERILDPAAIAAPRGRMPVGALEEPRDDDVDDQADDDEIAAAEPPAPDAAPPPASAALAELLSSVRVERTASGALRLEAPPQAASALAGVFEVMAALLRTSGSPPS